MITRVAKAIQRVLQEESNGLARETQFVQRERKLTGTAFS